ncbi:glutamate synthase-related protein [Kangiella sp. HZ709]|uniref:glutamate synthase-related protein n=1 Tax=Kangiella sp. HZ709 TaxID=2666328 RepID=UPI0012B04935|nr:glutamate synthase-related protein [Kangiella sp. HZ709]MRX26887.1 glutamate synthase [Kangiella sp. HZ709]
MDKPIVFDNAPAKVSLTKDKEYYFCSCGRSKSQPFCDGSHVSTNIQPKSFKADDSGEAFLCQCKQTKTPPYCDGSHTKIKDSQIGKELKIIDAASNTAPQAVATKEEPTVALIHQLAKSGLDEVGKHGPMGSMGVPRTELPSWDDIQLLPAQLAKKPLLDDAFVSTSIVIGPNAKKPLELKIPLLVSDMSYGALSEEAKVALSKGAQLAGTGICSGEGGMLPEEQAENSRYFYELASAKFGWDINLMKNVQAFHFKGGQGAKTGTGGHLPGAKVKDKIAAVRGLQPGQAAISPSTFQDLITPRDFKKLADEVREISGGIPIGFKLSANHIEEDIDFALKASADYIIIDGRGGGTGAAPLLFRNNISVPTIPALARARKHLDLRKKKDVTLIATGGLRVAEDFVKAMALGADAIAVSNSAMQAIGCVAARMCNSNNCPTGIATQKEHLRALLDVEEASQKLARFFFASVELMKVLSRACGHNDLSQFSTYDLTTWKKEMTELSGVKFGGVL